MVKRTRAPGGGRKPQGEYQGKAATISTRITPELRRDLDAYARNKRYSLSQGVEHLLRSALDREKESRRAPEFRAFVLLLGEVLRRMGSTVDPTETASTRSTKTWLNDRSRYETFRQSILLLLDKLAPPVSRERPTIPPDEIAAKVVDSLWDQLTTATDPTAELSRALNLKPGALLLALPAAKRDLAKARGRRL
jgi:hypothetical protein